MNWIRVDENIPRRGQKVLAIVMKKPDSSYKSVARGWFEQEMYTTRFDHDCFIINPYGPELPATHWMPLPELPVCSEENLPISFNESFPLKTSFKSLLEFRDSNKEDE